jgi:AcrR family transcriptional regulator
VPVVPPPPATPAAIARHRIVTAAYVCIGRSGLGGLTVEEAASEAGVSRATVYRHFPGGRDELVREAVAHEVGHFFLDLAAAVEGQSSFEAVLEQALLHAHAAVADHSVLQALLATEPGRLLPNLTVEAHRLLPLIAAFLEPYLAAERLRPGIEVGPAAEYVARMVLSLVGAPGRWDLTDRCEVRELVRSEIVAGILLDAPVAPVRRRPAPGAGVHAEADVAAPPSADGTDRRILDGAVRALARWGVARSSLDDIAKEAGCSRATVYRAFPGGKDTLLLAVVADEVSRFTAELRSVLAGADTLEDLLVSGMTFAVRSLTEHDVLQLLLAHEPELVLPHVSFAGLDRFLAVASQLAAPHLRRFMDDELALRTGEWLTRLVLSHTLSPGSSPDLTDSRSTRSFVRSYVLPGLTSPPPGLGGAEMSSRSPEVVGGHW